MRNYLVTYDLRKPGRDYTKLFEAIKSLTNSWWHCLESVWIIRHNGSASTIMNALKAHVDSNDKLFVVDVGSNWSSYNLDQECNDWLRNNL